MKLTHVAHMAFGAQDGAFWDDLLFRFNANGDVRVFDARPLDTCTGEVLELPLLASFRINPEEPLVPHFNAVAFGCEKYVENDRFPLLYANIYNNYATQENRLEGTCPVYRLTEEEGTFAMTLVQVLQIGFADTLLWRSSHGKDVRPYGNFVIDRDMGLLYVYTMRDEDKVSRYFTFKLPTLADGVRSDAWGVPVVKLTKDDILAWFDVPYHNYIQGGCAYGGKVYSSEGFSNSGSIPPALRVVDMVEKKQREHLCLPEIGLNIEAEWMDFRGDVCYYSDAHGDIFRVDLEA